MTPSGPPPNILFAIADDWSWPHAGAYGDRSVRTPAFDRVAAEGVLFTHAFCAAPQCSPSRAAILTGRYIWQLEEAGAHRSSFPKKWPVYPDLLESAGYHIGYTGKPWAPGSWRQGGWDRNPVGPEYNRLELDSVPASGISTCDYAGNFREFLAAREPGQPFCFWYGCKEPHRGYERNSGRRAGKTLDSVMVPGFLSDDPLVRSDLLDYALEIDWYDRHLGLMLQALEEAGELDRTLVVVTSDNGMPFPRAKANNYEYGTHMPLAIRWPERVPGGRVVDDLVNFVDLAPTFLEAAGIGVPETISGRSFLDVLSSRRTGRVDPTRDRTFTGRERHAHARFDNLGYPVRSIRTHDYLYLRNFEPDRWPAGDPTPYGDIDNSPTKRFMVRALGREPFGELAELALGRRPAEELYDVRSDPSCLVNLAGLSEHAAVQKDLSDELTRVLTRQGDPRLVGPYDLFDSYPRFGSFKRSLGGFSKVGQYNPAYQAKASK